MKKQTLYSYGAWFYDPVLELQFWLVQTGPGKGQLIHREGNRMSDEPFDISYPGRTLKDIQKEYKLNWGGARHGKLVPLLDKPITL